MFSKIVAIVGSVIFMFYITNGQMIRKEFEVISLRPGMKEVIEECTKSSDVKVEELKDYKTILDVSKEELAFYYCFYQGIGFLNKDGKPNLQAVKDMSADERKASGLTDEMIECLGKIDEIKEPEHLKKLAACYP